MNAKEARELIDQVCAELDAARDRPEQVTSFVRRVVRPASLGLLMGLGSAGALAGCGETGDLYGIPPAGDAYGIRDAVEVGPGLDMYGITDMPPAGDLYGINDLPPKKDTLEDGVPAPDILLPADLYGVVDGPVPDIIPSPGDAYGVDGANG